MPRRRSDEEQKKLYQQWQQSGLNIIEFCKQKSISNASIWRWKKKFGAKAVNEISNNSPANDLQDLKFYPISKIKEEKNSNPKSMTKAEEAGSKKCLLELALPKGINCKIHLSEKSMVEFIYGLLK